MARNIRILLSTAAELTGLRRVGQYIQQHSRLGRGLAAVYRASGAAARTAFRGAASAARLVGRELRMIRNAAAGAAAAITAIAVDGVRQWMRQDEATKGLRATVQSLGYDAEALMPKFSRLANSIQKATRTGDDETERLMRSLLQMGVVPEQMEKAVRDVIGLATASGRPIETAAQYYAMALEGQFDMLNRFIPQVRAATTEQEKMAALQRYMATGWQQEIELATELGGRYRQMMNRFGDLRERIGQTVSEGLNLSNVFHAIEQRMHAIVDSDIWERITTGIQSAATRLIAQVRTAWDLIQQIRDSDFGLARGAAVAKTLVTEIITLAVTLFISLIQAHVGIFLGIVKMLAAAFKEEIYASDLPGMGRIRRGAAMGQMATMSPEQQQTAAEGAGIPWDTGMQRAGVDAAIGDNRSFKRWFDGLTTQQQAALAAGESATQLSQAFDDTRASLGGIVSDITNQFTRSAANIKSSAAQATGGAFDWDARAAAHRETAAAFISDPAQAIGNLPATAADPRRGQAIETARGQIDAAQQRAAGIGPTQGAGGAGMQAVYQARTNRLQAEQRLIEQLEQKIEALETENTDGLDRIITAIERLAENQKKQSQRISRLPL